MRKYQLQLGHQSYSLFCQGNAYYNDVYHLLGLDFCVLYSTLVYLPLPPAPQPIDYLCLRILRLEFRRITAQQTQVHPWLGRAEVLSMVQVVQILNCVV
jgi:hypothetical protein